MNINPKNYFFWYDLLIEDELWVNESLFFIKVVLFPKISFNKGSPLKLSIKIFFVFINLLLEYFLHISLYFLKSLLLTPIWSTDLDCFNLLYINSFSSLILSFEKIWLKLNLCFIKGKLNLFFFHFLFKTENTGFLFLILLRYFLCFSKALKFYLIFY